ncbi:hypothetical protein C7974DRAFT_403874 [Boeremia exigua]|uniref:uncharacterized protein n=1 Tax=Boeremia exigua TaxID=749465 RepID=UPI001E8D9048|nr:uncharacterized protein C7974DRAFT_403874 [Boeremia exigua]KAH6615394.1 hypothetical protein C7974DRAFT_403874 [Boeremia exigua]
MFLRVLTLLVTPALGHALASINLIASPICPASTLAISTYITTIETYITRTTLAARRCPTLTTRVDGPAPTISCTFDSSSCDEPPYCVRTNHARPSV